MSTSRLFDVSQGVNEKKKIANYLVLCVQLKQTGGHRRHIIQVLLQSSEAAQVTEIASTGKASGSNVDKHKMTVSCRLNVGHFIHSSCG